MSDLLLLSPILLCGLTGVLVLVLDLLAAPGTSGFLGYVVAAGFALSGVAAFAAWGGDTPFSAPYLTGMLHPDACARFFAVLCLAAGAFTALLFVTGLAVEGIDQGEIHALLAFSATGMLVVIAAIDLVAIFLGLEILSLALYALTASKRTSPVCVEAGVKYFVLGGVATALFLFGVALLFGATGKFDLVGIARHFAEHDPTRDWILPQTALLFLVAALGFKVAAVPFHFWTPDVYEGAPSPVVPFMAGAVKAAGFAVLARILLTVYQDPGFQALPLAVPDVLLVLAVASMTIGNLLGIVQTDVRRILAYSSIAHAGYVLLGVYATRELPGDLDGLGPSVPFYVATYAAATLGAFGIVSLVAGRGDANLDRLAGMGRRHPLLSFLLLLCLLSLAGVPPLAGFLGKFELFRDVLSADPERNLPWVLVAVLNSVVALYYYLCVAVAVCFRDAAGDATPTNRSIPGALAVGAAALFCVYAGLFPGKLLTASDQAARAAVIVSEKAGPKPAEPERKAKPVHKRPSRKAS